MNNECLELPWTGERYVPELRGNIALEHLHRYALASEFVKGKRVLDIASGEGYGSEMLSRTAASVIGVDIDPGTIEHAQKKYRKKNLCFKKGRCEQIPLLDHSVDVVVSFETIEHLDDHQKMLSEIKRVLTPGGILIVSTPDKHEYTEVPKHHNQFHLKELCRNEFENLLGVYFKNQKILGQRIVYGSSIFEIDGPSCFGGLYEFNKLLTEGGETKRSFCPLYLIAFCSDGHLDSIDSTICEQLLYETEAYQSINNQLAQKAMLFNEQKAILLEKNIDIQNKDSLLAQKENLINQKNKLIYETEKPLQNQTAIIDKENVLLAKKEKQLKNKNQELAQKEEALTEQKALNSEKERQLSKLNDILDNHKNIYNSFSWKCSLPLRSLEGLSKKALNRFRKHKLPLKTYKLGLVIFLKHARSGVFDGTWYLEQNRDVKDARWNPFLHFLLYGMYEGRAPNATFNIANYIEENSDVKTNDISPVLHFMQWGENEERNAYRRITKFLKAILPFPEDKQVVLVFGHEATRTGAPIALLGIIKKLSQEKKFHFITVLKRGGALLSDYQNVCPTLVLGDASGKTFKSSAINTKYFEWIAAHLDSFKGRITCLCSTVDSKEAVAAFGERNFGIISLIYEMPTSINKWFGGANTMRIFDQYSYRLIFPSRFTHRQILEEYKINEKRTRVIHLGIALAYPETERLLLREKILSELGLPNNTILVVGCGAYDYRKGFDLFIKTGEKFIYNSINKNQPVPTFLWVGTYFGCDYAAKEISKIPEDIRKHFFFLDERPSVEEIIAAADVFFLSSREDPFPLVALIAAGHGVPILLFSGATGIEHALPQQSYYVASNLDVHVACAALTKALEQVDFKTCSKLIREEFSPEIYAKKIALELDSLRLPLEVEVTAVENNVVHKDLYHVAANARCFSGNISNRDLFKGKVLLFKIIKYFSRVLKGGWPKTEGIKKLSSSIQNSIQKVVPQNAWAWPCDYGKKPIPEFHPGIYKEEYMRHEDTTDPFAHFLQAGRPQGRWNPELLSIKSMKQNLISSNLRIGLHLHVFYGDLLSDIIRRLEANEVRPDLLITIPNSVKDIGEIREILKKYPGKVEIRTTPNKGRDIGAFLTEFGSSVVDEYDIIGHVHTKKSIHATTDIAKKWREFLLENLLGGRVPMADVIIGTMTQEEKIGLVFPSDPYTNGWDKNRSTGKKLLLRLGINKFHEQFNFPVGTMFWARTNALKPLLDLNLTYEDYPEEPIPIDGTILHALERILPFVVEKEKYQIKMTHVEGVTR